MQNKTRFHYIPIRIAQIQDTDNTNVSEELSYSLLIEIKNVTVTLEDSLEIS